MCMFQCQLRERERVGGGVVIRECVVISSASLSFNLSWGFEIWIFYLFFDRHYIVIYLFFSYAHRLQIFVKQKLKLWLLVKRKRKIITIESPQTE